MFDVGPPQFDRLSIRGHSSADDAIAARRCTLQKPRRTLRLASGRPTKPTNLQCTRPDAMVVVAESIQVFQCMPVLRTAPPLTNNRRGVELFRSGRPIKVGDTDFGGNGPPPVKRNGYAKLARLTVSFAAMKQA